MNFFDEFCTQQILNVFKNMPAGHLHLILPDATEYYFGEKLPGPKAVIYVHNWLVFRKCFLYGDIGLGESYSAAYWDSPDLEKVIEWFIANIQYCPTLSGTSRKAFVNLLSWVNKIQHRMRANTIRGSQKNIQDHYDLSNEFFRFFLDPTMTYSSAYFENSNEDLQTAQERKYDVLCQKLRLKPADHLLEIGCGWGGFSLYAAQKYQVKIKAITVSKAQLVYVQEQIQKKGLNDLVSVILQDYRDVCGHFDKIVSIEMLEAVGDSFLETYFAKCQTLLKKSGLLALQYIACPDDRYAELKKGVDWIQKYIFPGSLLLSIHHVNSAIFETGGLFLNHLEDISDSYALTLKRWRQTFNAHLPQVRTLGFDETFIRQWNYYLAYCQAAFWSRNIHVVQALYTFANNPNLHKIKL